MRRTLLLLSCLPLVSAAAQTPLRYRYESVTRATTEMPNAQMDIMSMMPGLADREIRVFALLSITTKDSAGGTVYHLVVDSIEDNQAELLNSVRSLMPPGAEGRDTSIAKMMNGLTASGQGGTIHALVRSGKVTSQKVSIPGNIQLAQMGAVIGMLIPQPKMLTARWNDSWIDSGAVAVPGADLGGVKVKQKGYTKWRVTAKDTIDAVISTTLDLDTDSLVAGMPAGSQEDSLDREAMKKMSMKNATNGTQRVILDANKKVRETSSVIENNMNMSLGEMGDMVVKSKSTISLVRIP